MGRNLSDILDSLPPDRRQRIAEERDAILEEVNTLRDLRQHAQSITQAAIARKLDISQAAVSKTEKRPVGQLSLGALDRYVEALGGTVDVRIQIPGHSPVRLTRLRDLTDSDDDSNTDNGTKVSN